MDYISQSAWQSSGLGVPAAPVAGDNAADSERGGSSGFSPEGTTLGPEPPTQLCTGGMKGTGGSFLLVLEGGEGS